VLLAALPSLTNAKLSTTAYRSGAKYLTTLIIAPAHISVLNGVFACFIVPLIAVGRF
jgi:hypothetical protein